jgi:hypothetical protein
MTIIVEDGTLSTGSPEGSAIPNSYITRAELKQFAKDRGIDDVQGADGGELDDSLIKATDYMAQKMRMLWKGSRVKAFQALDWPRRGVDVPDFFDPFFRNVNVPVSFQDTAFVPENEIPVEVKDVQAFLAIATFAGGTTSTLDELQPGVGRTTRLEQVGTLKVEYMTAQDDAAGGRVTTLYWNAMRRAEPFLLAAAPHTGRVVRS